LKLDKNANDWNLSRSRYWEFRYNMEKKTNKKKIVGSVEELYNESKNQSLLVSKENPFKGFEIGNMDESNYDLIDLHKNVVEITLVLHQENQ
jgi:isoleucyl-tRNA synthetase